MYISRSEFPAAPLWAFLNMEVSYGDFSWQNMVCFSLAWTGRLVSQMIDL
jgi:hypothetical protein